MPEEQPGLDYLWKQAPVFPIGATFTQPHLLSQYNWNFSNLEDAFKQGGVLHGEEKVFLFTCADREVLLFDGRRKETTIPFVVVIVSPFSPSDKVKVLPVKDSNVGVVDMEKMNMAWLPCIPLVQRGASLEMPLPQISMIRYVQAEASSGCIELVPSPGPGPHVCFPYFDNPYEVDERKQSTVVDIVYPTEAGVIVEKFNWKFFVPEGFTNRLIDAGKLSRDHKDAFKAFVLEKVEEGKRANREANQQKINTAEELRRIGDEKVAAFDKMRFYKFYPVATPDTPDVSIAKGPYINKYYGKAHQVF